MFENVKLGKLAPSRDPRTLQLVKYVDEALPAAPSSFQCGQKVASYPMYGNDQYGDCTCAAVGHMAEAWTSWEAQAWGPTTAEVMDLYWATGDGSGTDDTGRVETDVLNYWRNNGFGGRKDKITAYTQVDTTNRPLVKQAAFLFGGLYIGIALPITAQGQSQWSVVAGSGSDGDPGSWGGHAVNVTAYTSQYVTVITWGQRLRMTWGFWNKYVDEAYALLSPDWASTLPHGFNMAALAADLAAI
jgi:hypothetical protein